MNISKKTIDGLVPVTDDELWYMAINHVEYDLTRLDTSGITDMRYLFDYEKSFNQDIGGWDTSNVSDMECMFYGAVVFNQDISRWDTNDVIDMDYMFNGTKAFNQDLSGWDVGNVIDYRGFADNADNYKLPRPKFLL